MIPSFFEGPEKKLELVVVDGHPSLRSLGETCWRAVAAAAGAQILSRRSTRAFDAYLLSESSLFVFDNFVTMITCGRTALVRAVEAVLRVVRAEDVAVLIYERKNEHFPEHQPTSFFDDARRLRQLLPGEALRFGSEHEHSVHVFHTTRPFAPDAADTTLEVLMHGIHPDRARLFHGMDAAEGGTIAARLGLDRILEGFEIDEHVFEPAGYSLNAVRDASYYTIHVTPERHVSYVSFETNHDFRADPSGLVRRVLGCFVPESFDVVAFVPGEEPLSVQIDGYVQRRHVRSPVAGYHVTFQHFFRPAAAPTAATSIPLRG